MTRHLNTLSILHYVYGVFTCLMGLGVLVLVVLGVFINSDFLVDNNNEAPPAWLGGLLQTMGWGIFIFVELTGLLIILSGHWIAKRRNRTASLIIAGLCCLNFPLGIALGIYTFAVLLSADVQEEYHTLTGRMV